MMDMKVNETHLNKFTICSERQNNKPGSDNTAQHRGEPRVAGGAGHGDSSSWARWEDDIWAGSGQMSNSLMFWVCCPAHVSPTSTLQGSSGEQIGPPHHGDPTYSPTEGKKTVSQWPQAPWHSVAFQVTPPLMGMGWRDFQSWGVGWAVSESQWDTSLNSENIFEAQWKWTWLVSTRTRDWSLASPSGLGIWHCRELRCRLAAAAAILPLAWEPPYASLWL